MSVEDIKASSAALSNRAAQLAGKVDTALNGGGGSSGTPLDETAAQQAITDMDNAITGMSQGFVPYIEEAAVGALAPTKAKRGPAVTSLPQVNVNGRTGYIVDQDGLMPYISEGDPNPLLLVFGDSVKDVNGSRIGAVLDYMPPAGTPHVVQIAKYDRTDVYDPNYGKFDLDGAMEVLALWYMSSGYPGKVSKSDLGSRGVYPIQRGLKVVSQGSLDGPAGGSRNILTEVDFSDVGGDATNMLMSSGSVPVDSALYTPGIGGYTHSYHHMMLSGRPASYDRETGISIGQAVSTHVSPVINQLAVQGVSLSGKIEGLVCDNVPYVFVGGIQNGTPNPVNEDVSSVLYRINPDDTLTAKGSSVGYGTGALTSFSRGGDALIAQAEYMVGAGGDAPIRFHNVSENIQELLTESVSTVTGGATGIMDFTANGDQFFITWNDDANSAKMWFLSDSNSFLSSSLPVEMQALKSVFLYGYNSDGTPSIGGIDGTNLLIFKGTLSQSGLSFSGVPTNTIALDSLGPSTPYAPAVVGAFKGSDGFKTLYSTQIESGSLSSSSPGDGWMLSTDGTPASAVNELGTASVVKPVMIDGYMYLICLERAASSYVHIYRHTDGVNLVNVASVSANDPVDVTYLNANGGHLLAVLENGGTILRTLSLEVNNAMLSWKGMSFKA